jgi:hypothetical protein
MCAPLDPGAVWKKVVGVGRASIHPEFSRKGIEMPTRVEDVASGTRLGPNGLQEVVEVQVNGDDVCIVTRLWDVDIPGMPSSEMHYRRGEEISTYADWQTR